MQINSDPISCDRVPFANERQLQRFIVTNAAALFNADVVATSLPHGRPLFRVDILAIDRADRDRVLAIECKWDAIDAPAIRQVLDYNDQLVNARAAVEERIAQRLGRGFRLVSAPTLVTIGYRCKGTLSPASSVETVIFKYLGESFPRLVDHQRPGRVQLGVPEEIDHHRSPHPEVLKTSYAKARTAHLPSTLRESFWAIDARLRATDGILPKYSGKKTKNFASYRCGRRVFATASIGTESIIWHCGVDRGDGRGILEMDIHSDFDEVFRIIHGAYDAV